MNDTRSAGQDSQWNRGAFVALGASLLLMLTVIALNVYRYSLPTDGWAYNDNDFENGVSENLLQLPSDLQVGDIPITIGDIPTQILANLPLGQAADLPSDWRPGGRVLLTVKRGEQTMMISVPIGYWNLFALWKSFLSAWLNYITALVYFLIGALVFGLRPGNHAAQVLLFLGTVRFAMGLVLLIPFGIGDAGSVIAYSGTALFGFYIWGILLFPTFFLLSLIFPKSKRPFRTHPILTLAFLYLLEPILLLVFGSLSADAGPGVGFGLVAVLGFLTVISILHTLVIERGDAVARAQILWVGLGVALVAGFQFVQNALGFVFGTLVVSGPLNWWVYMLGSLVYLAVPVTVAIAILRYRLFDIDVIIRRTVTYTLVVALLAVVYFGSVVVLQQIFSKVLGLGQNESITVLSTLGIAALFVPLRNRIQRVIDQRFNRKKYNAQQVLQNFAETVRDETDLEKLTARLMQVVDETMQPDNLSVWLKRNKRQGKDKA